MLQVQKNMYGIWQLLSFLSFNVWKMFLLPWEKLFLTVSNVKKELDRLDSEQGAMPEASDERENSPELEVTDMDQDKLVVQIKGSENTTKRKKHLSESADDIEVVYEKEMPKIPGILKQRSRTLSESSCDEIFSSVPYNRQSSCNSLTGSYESPGSLQESDENTDSSGRKKSVSFSEVIDQTSYKANASVSTLHATLKNKRRKQRKRETKKEGKQSRRRRTSSCSEPSSDEQGSSNSPDNGHNNDGDVNGDDGEAEDCPGDNPTVEKENSGDDLKDDSDATGDKVLRTCEQIEANDYGTKGVKSVQDEREGEAQPNSGKQISATVNCSKKGKKNNKKGKKGQQAIEDGTNDSDVRECEKNGEKECVKESSKKEVEHEKSINGKQDVNEEDQKEVSKEVDDKSETVLSWEDRKEVLDPLGDHTPKCAVSFSNSVIYDLDVE